MKLTISVTLAAAAGFVNAAPYINAYVDKYRPNPEVGRWAQNVRWGHAAANAEFLPAIRMTTPSPNHYPAYAPTATQPSTTSFPEYAGRVEYAYRPAPTGQPWIMTAPNPTMAVPTGYPMAYRPHPPPDPEWIGFGKMLSAEIGEKQMARKGGCRMRKMRNKSLQWGNKFRVIFGLPPIQEFGFIRHEMPAVPVIHTFSCGPHGQQCERISDARQRVPTHHHHVHIMHQMPPFHARLTHALASLGPWEGRAVSFVLGCGLGVLLRMLFVFGVLIVRGVRCRRAQRRVALVEDSVIFDVDIKEPVRVEALPAYAEKAETQAEEVPQANNAN